MNKEEHVGDEKEGSGMKDYAEELLRKEARIILQVVLKEQIVEEREIIKELEEKEGIRRATAYKKIQKWIELKLLEEIKDGGRKNKKVKVRHGLRKELQEITEKLEELEEKIVKIENNQEERNNGSRRNKIYTAIKKVEE